MVLTFEEEKELTKLKHEQYKEFEILRHKNVMEELEMQLKIAEAYAKGGGK